MGGVEEFYIEKPIFSPKEDLFGVSDSARRFANLLFSIDKKETCTIGITGAWGMGKTSYLNLVKHYMHEDHRKEMKKTVVLDFDASCFFKTKALFLEYFSQLRCGIEEKQGSAKGILQALNVYSDALFDVLDLIPSINGLGKVLKDFKSKSSKEKTKTLTQKKNKLANEIEKSNLQFIVFIDDFDRLPQKQIKSILQLIYAVAKFKKTKYILSYDKEIVSRAIKKYYKLEDGKEFLEKVVQYEHPLPKPLKLTLEKQFMDNVFGITENFQVVWTDEDINDFRIGYEMCIEPFIKTPRDIHLIINSFNYAYGYSIGNELEILDLLIVCTLKARYAKLYEFIYMNSHLFFSVPMELRSPIGNVTDEELEKHNAQVDAAAKSLNLTRTEQAILCFLFPTFKDAYFPREYNFLTRKKSIMKKRAICVEDAFPLYFADKLLDGFLPREEIKKILSEYDERKIVKIHQELIERKTFDFYMNEIALDNISPERCAVLSKALILTYPYAVNSPDVGHYFDSYTRTLFNNTQNYLVKTGKRNSFELMKELILSGDFIFVYQMLAYIIENGKFHKDGRGIAVAIFSDADFEKISKLYYEYICELIHSDKSLMLFDATRSLSFFRLLNKAVEEKSQYAQIFSDWMNQVLQIPKQMLVFYSIFESGTYQQPKPKYLNVLSRQDEILAQITNEEEESLDEFLKHWLDIWRNEMGNKEVHK